MTPKQASTTRPAQVARTAWTVRTVVPAAVLAVVLAVGGWLVRPGAVALADTRTGDPELQRFVDEHYQGPGHRLAVAVVDGAGTTFAGRGTDEHGRFEIGSITKGLTGLLLADAVSRGEVRLDQEVGSLLPLEGTPVASATLEDLATHHSGLPSISPQPWPAARSLAANLAGGNPYPYDAEQLLDHARAAGTDGRGEASYSNLGAALLGQAVARQAGKSYQDLLQERVLQPLGMRESRLPVGDDGAAPEGYGSGGRRQAPWIMDGYAPAGAVVSTTADLSLLARALLDGRSVAALAPRRDYEDERIGLFWLTSELDDGNSMVWHNGGTGGYRTFLGLDLERKRAVVVLSDVAVSVDDFGTELLEDR